MEMDESTSAFNRDFLAMDCLERITLRINTFEGVINFIIHSINNTVTLRGFFFFLKMASFLFKENIDNFFKNKLT